MSNEQEGRPARGARPRMEVTVKKHRFQVRVTYVMSRTYHVLAEDEDRAADVAMTRTPRFLENAEADVTEVAAAGAPRRRR
jgi:hypothetical protein